MWPSITYETCTWERSPDDLALIPKSRRRKILPTYEAAVPASIASLPVEISPPLMQRIAEVGASLARFDQAQASRDWSLPALLLRSESSSSSQIERLTSSVRNVALAELSDKAPANALLIAGNVAAMREALGQRGAIDVTSICSVHDVLMRGTGESQGLRDEQVWIGGSPYSPHGATFVPPHANRVRPCLEDLVAFGMREDIPPIAKAAVFHAQFETIHPFVNANGRTGRLISNFMLMRAGYEPVNIQAESRSRYIAALRAFSEQDDPYPFAAFFCINLHERLEKTLDMLSVKDGQPTAWRISEIGKYLSDT